MAEGADAETLRAEIESLKEENARLRRQLSCIEARSEEHLGRLDSLISVSQAVLAETTLQGLLQRVVDGARQLTRGRVAISGYGYRDGRISVGAASREGGVQKGWPGATFRIDRGGVYLDLIYERTSLRLTTEELLQHPRWRGLPKGHWPLRGLLGARLVGRDGQANGLIMVSDKEEGEFTAEDEAILMQLAALTSLGLQHIEATQAAEHQAKQLLALLEGMKEAVTVFDGEGNVVLRNEASRQLTMLPSDEDKNIATYRSISAFYPDGRPMPREEWAPNVLLRRGPFTDMEYFIQRADGSRRRVITNGSVVRDDDGRVALAITVSRDVTELRRLEEVREDFLRAVSHDLRQPMTVILGQAQMLKTLMEREKLDDRKRRSLAGLTASTKRMAQMISDLVEATQLESGSLPMDLAPVDLYSYALALLERMEEVREDARVRVEEPRETPLALADAGRLERVLGNLVCNALRYSTPPSPVVVKFSRQASSIVTSVCDEGRGIAADELRCLFERNYRSLATRDCKSEGLGLGLYISRLLIEAQGGRIWAESEPGRGSTFSFSLPVAQ